MKLWKFVLFLVAYLYININTYSQTSCKYSYSWGFSVESFELLDSNNFIYRNSSCTHSIIGHGKYKKTKRNIKLYFDRGIELKSSFVDKIDSIANFNSDTFNILFLVKDINQNRIEFASVSILDSAYRGVKSTFTDSNGIAKLSVKKIDNIRFVQVSMITYKKLVAPINDNNFNYTFIINLNFRQEIVPDNWKIFTYKIGKQTGDKIEFKKGKSKYLAYKVNCKN